MSVCWVLQTHSEADLTAAHHVVQEGVLSHELQKQKELRSLDSGHSRVMSKAWNSG